MKKNIKKYLSIYLSIFIILIMVLKPIDVSAHDGSGSGFSSVNNITIQSPIGPSGSALDAYLYTADIDGRTLPEGIYFYYKYDNNKVYYSTFYNVVGDIITHKIGLSVASTVFTDIVNHFETFILNNLTGNGTVPLRPVVIRNNNDYVLRGFALNDLSDCLLVAPSSGDGNKKITVPSDLVNDVKEDVDNYISTNGTLDYFNLVPYTKNEVSGYFSSDRKTFIDNSSGLLLYLYYNTTAEIYTGTPRDYLINGGSNIFYANTESIFNNFVSLFALSDVNNAVSGSDIYNFSSPQSNSFTFNSYNTLEGNNNVNVNYYDGTSHVESSISFQFGGSNKYFVTSDTPITIYKNLTIRNQVINNTYSPTYMYSTTYNNFNTSNDNSYSSSITNINNGGSSNTNIYNQQSNEYKSNQYYNESNDYYIDNSQTNSNNTTIINNYYGDDSGGDDDDDDDDDSIWDALLKALGDFLKKIGELLATILTGIISICTSVLDAIASIAESFTGITDFIGSIIGFMPSDIIAVLTLGITLAVLISLIKIFRG